MGFDGNEYEFGQYVEVYSARTKKGFVSSATYGDDNGALVKTGGNCLGWDCYQKEIEEGIDREHRSVSLRRMHVFTLIHLANYHLVEVLDDEGNVRKYEHGKRAGETIYDRELCEGSKCPHCKAGAKKVFGKRLHWSLGQGHLSQLAGVIESIEQDCTNCGGRGTISIPKWACEKCGKTVLRADKFDLDNEEDRKRLAEKKRTPTQCKHCGETSIPLPVRECEKCDDPTPLSIFDCDIEVKREGEGSKSTIQVPRWTAKELSDELKEMAEPWQFDKIFFPDPFAIQMTTLRIHGECPYKDEPSQTSGKSAVSKASSPKNDDNESENSDEHTSDYADYDD